MKKNGFNIYYLAFTLLTALPQLAHAEDILQFPELTTVTPEHLFIPSGFDSNDNAQIVLAGNLPNTCHRVGQTDVRVDKKNFRILLNHQNYIFVGCWCGMVITPYSQSADLGVLPAGKYEVLTYNVKQELESRSFINISTARTNSPDEYHYAPVEEVSMEPARPGKPYTLVLKGTFTSDCMNLEEVRTKYTDGNVIEVLPITDLRDGAECKPDKRAFTTRIELKPGLSGKHLVHVRTVSGQAINKVLDL